MIRIDFYSVFVELQQLIVAIDRELTSSCNFRDDASGLRYSSAVDDNRVINLDCIQSIGQIHFTSPSLPAGRPLRPARFFSVSSIIHGKYRLVKRFFYQKWNL